VIQLSDRTLILSGLFSLTMPTGPAHYTTQIVRVVCDCGLGLLFGKLLTFLIMWAQACCRFGPVAWMGKGVWSALCGVFLDC
jgi:hypothetical protein